MDLEIMTVDVNLKDYVTRDYIAPRYYRTMIRKKDETGDFRRFTIELEQLANQYSKTLDEVLELFESFSCSKPKLYAALKGENKHRWTPLEDLVLKN